MLFKMGDFADIKRDIQSIKLAEDEKESMTMRNAKQLKKAMSFALKSYIQAIRELPSLNLGDFELRTPLPFKGFNIEKGERYSIYLNTNGTVAIEPINCNGHSEPWRKSTTSITNVQSLVQNAIDLITIPQKRVEGYYCISSLAEMTSSDIEVSFCKEVLKYKPLPDQEIEDRVKNELLSMIRIEIKKNK